MTPSFLVSIALDGSMARGELAGLEDASARAASPPSQIAAQPLPGRWRGDALQGSSLYDAKALQCHLLDHLQETGQTQVGHAYGCSFGWVS